MPVVPSPTRNAVCGGRRPQNRPQGGVGRLSGPHLHRGGYPIGSENAVAPVSGPLRAIRGADHPPLFCAAPAVIGPAKEPRSGLAVLHSHDANP